MQCPFDPKKKEKIVMNLIFLENKRGLELLMLRSMITANDRYSGNDCYSGIKGPDHFFHYSGRWLYTSTFWVNLQSRVWEMKPQRYWAGLVIRHYAIMFVPPSPSRPLIAWCFRLLPRWWNCKTRSPGMGQRGRLRRCSHLNHSVPTTCWHPTWNPNSSWSNHFSWKRPNGKKFEL